MFGLCSHCNYSFFYSIFLYFSSFFLTLNSRLVKYFPRWSKLLNFNEWFRNEHFFFGITEPESFTLKPEMCIKANGVNFYLVLCANTPPISTSHSTNNLFLALYICHLNTINPTQFRQPASAATSEAHCNIKHTAYKQFKWSVSISVILISSAPPSVLFL